MAMVFSFEDWAARRPFYEALIELVRQDIDNMVDRLSRVGAQELAGRTGAAFSSDDIMTDQFVEFWQRLDRNGKRLLAAALVLALVMNLPLWSLPNVVKDIARIARIQFRDDFPEPGQTIPYEAYRYR